MEGATSSPETLFSAAEEQANTLKAQLLASADAAAEKLVGDTKAEGQRRIEAANRRAKALSETVEAIERAEKELVQRTRIFKETSKALRTDLESFMQMLLDAENQLQVPANVSELRLVEAKPEPPSEAPEPPSAGSGTSAVEPDEPIADKVPDPTVAAPATTAKLVEPEPEPEPELEVLVDTETETELEPVAEAEEEVDEDDDEPPTPEQIRRFFGESDPEPAPKPAAKRERFYDQTRDDDRTVWSRLTPTVAAEHLGRRDKIAAELGGVLIGLGGTFALIRFVLLG